jgi:acyl-CoA synthetase (AMP-forming)/AMP-acid ligase II
MAGLEKTFGVPVLQSYGMTEASHQVASNPLPPAPRKPGSVGRSGGPEIGIMDEDGRFLPAGEEGEVVIRGANVTAGYEANPEANAASFVNGWFRTGDQGRLDDEGYLWLTGRLKEMINRGGEKVSPLEIEAVLMTHPGVQQVVVFAMPDESHGEEVAAAVVKREGAQPTDRELRHFVAGHLADFKVPRKFVFVEQIPTGPTGKLQRVGLAARLGLVEPQGTTA